MKIVLSIIVFVALMLFVGRTTISVSPFSIHMERPWIVVGIILLVLAIGAIQYDSYCKGSQKVRNELLNKEG
ncbi:hypothetical protein BFS16_00625 [Hoylesella timonensis]|uniref:Uncharacterized protein n=1 Tax=Hoylesella timonensis TaxID=386414 RepID=A0A2K0XPI7_9BACT|nr:hypothetical protein BFS16_00625 [Hoylesella timonensis]